MSRSFISALFVVLCALGCAQEELPVEIIVTGGTTSEGAKKNTTNGKNLPPKNTTTIDNNETVTRLVIGEGSADSSTIEPLLGVVSGPNPPYKSLAPNVSLSLSEIGIRSIRNDAYLDDRLDMEGMFVCPGYDEYPAWDCDPSDMANYQFSDSDAQFESWLNDPYFEPFFRLGGEARSDVIVHDFKGPQNKAQEENWIYAARIVLTHFQILGTLDYVDIWTEWPGQDYWDRSDAEFVNFWARAFDALSDSFPKLKFGGPGFSTDATRDVIAGKKAAAFDFLVHLHKKGLRPHWIGWHLHSNDPGEFHAAGKAYRDLLSGTGAFDDVPWNDDEFFAGVESIADSWGPSDRDKDGKLYPILFVDQVYNRQQGAAISTSAWIAMQDTNVSRAFYRYCVDNKSNPLADPASETTLYTEIGGPGLFYGDASGAYKRTAHAVRLWSRMVDEFPNKRQLTADNAVAGADNKRLWALAGDSKNGQRAILLANPNDVTVDWQVEWADNWGSASDGKTVTVYELNASQDGKSGQEWTGGASFQASPYTVQLVVFAP